MRRETRIQRTGLNVKPGDMIPEIIIEENELGRPQSPQMEVDRLKAARYKTSPGQLIRLHISTGTGDAGEIILGRPLTDTGNLFPMKVYRLTQLHMGGLRRTVRANIELESWRTHEREWLAALPGCHALLRDPGTVNSVDTVTELRVASASLYRKLTSRRRQDPPLLGMIELRETLPSVLRRHRPQLVMALGGIVLAALLSALLNAAWRAIAG